MGERPGQRQCLEADAALLPLCRAEGIPFVYDVHHHRCLTFARRYDYFFNGHAYLHPGQTERGEQND